ncbi:pyocin activator PrtN family protein [Shimia thalassica]|uniref:pyocin activator PrtN family protein n=1 Tax=Shimia thalassica TaxID=1715693 RepID=UPI0026E1C645|nr:pyocin activator PrtN family protein [Shimia thalassica]MDO6480952.1 pyocin activator PrtN family protein [Shimia thalassica]
MQTQLMLMAQYDGATMVPADKVREDFFPHLTRPKFLRKIADGDIKLPLVQMEASQKAAKGVDIRDLAAYYDERRDTARRDLEKLHH